MDFFKEVIVPVISIIVVTIVLVFGLCFFLTIPEVELFNQHYGTNYTALQWFCARDTIKDYIGEGEVKRINVKVK